MLRCSPVSKLWSFLMSFVSENICIQAHAVSLAHRKKTHRLACTHCLCHRLFLWLWLCLYFSAFAFCLGICGVRVFCWDLYNLVLFHHKQLLFTLRFTGEWGRWLYNTTTAILDSQDLSKDLSDKRLAHAYVAMRLGEQQSSCTIPQVFPSHCVLGESKTSSPQLVESAALSSS